MFESVLDFIEFKYDEVKFRVRMVVRAVRHFWQRRTRGWDDSEVWNLDLTIAKFLTERLKVYKENNQVLAPSSMESNVIGFIDLFNMENYDDKEMLEDHWNNVLQIMIDGFGSYQVFSKDYNIERALVLFKKYFKDLWD